MSSNISQDLAFALLPIVVSLAVLTVIVWALGGDRISDAIKPYDAPERPEKLAEKPAGAAVVAESRPVRRTSARQHPPWTS